jgi:hypothetical protein
VRNYADFLKNMVTRLQGRQESHIRLTTLLKGEHHITVPKHKSLKVGTLNSILNDIASHLEMDKPVLIKELFRKK